MNIEDAAKQLGEFVGASLTGRVTELESRLKGISGAQLSSRLRDVHVSPTTLEAALRIKELAGQVNVAIHALGISIALEHILEPDERIEYLSLGAGNTGRDFDLETDRRVAEFKFIAWRGGPESIRQNQLFKDFYLLAESESPKQKELYVAGAYHPLKFLQGGRALESVMSRNNRLWREFKSRYGDRFTVVRDYFSFKRESVALVDLALLVPDAFGGMAASRATDDPDVSSRTSRQPRPRSAG